MGDLFADSAGVVPRGAVHRISASEILAIVAWLMLAAACGPARPLPKSALSQPAVPNTTAQPVATATPPDRQPTVERTPSSPGWDVYEGMNLPPPTMPSAGDPTFGYLRVSGKPSDDHPLPCRRITLVNKAFHHILDDGSTGNSTTTVTVHQDGRATSEEIVENLTKTTRTTKTGRLHPIHFGWACYLVEHFEFWSFEAEYRRPTSDCFASTVEVEAVARTHRVEDYCDASPGNMLALGWALQHIITRVQWVAPVPD